MSLCRADLWVTVALLCVSLLGLNQLEAQVEVFSFGESRFDARLFPQAVLTLLALACAVRVVLGLKTPTVQGEGSLGRWFTLVSLTGVFVAAWWLMPLVGFWLASSAVAVLTALAFGERRVLYVLVLPVVMASLIFFLATQGLGLPLPLSQVGGA